MSQPKTSVIDIPFNRGLRQDLEENVLPPGALATADDVEFDKVQRLQKRDGFSALGTTTLSKTNAFVGPAKRAAEGAQGEQIAFTDENAHLYFPEYDAMSEAGQAYAAGGQISAMRGNLTGRFNVGSDQAGLLQTCDSCCVGSWIVIAYVQLRPDGSATDLRVDVLDKVTKAKALSGYLAGLDIGAVPTSAGTLNVQVLALTANGGGSAIVLWAVGSALKYMLISLPTVGTIPNPTSGGTSLLTSSAVDCVLDATLPIFDAAATVTGFMIAYRYDNGGGNHWVQVCAYDINATPITSTLDLRSDPGTLDRPYDATSISVLGARNSLDTVFIVAGSAGGPSGAPADQFEMFFTDYQLSFPVGYDIKPYSTIDGWHVGDVQQSTLGRSSASIATFLWSPVATALTQNAVANGPRGPINIATIEDGAIGGAYRPVYPALSNYCLASRLYRDSAGNHYAWGRFNVATQSQSHYLLLDFCGNGDQSFRRPTPVLHVGNGLVQTMGIAGGLATGPVATPSMADLGDNEWLFCAPLNLGGSSALGQQIACWTGQALGPKRFLSTLGKKTLLVGGGTPLSYDGQRLVELSFYSYPEAGDPAVSATPGSLSAGDYQYRFVYEWTDAAGQRHQSPASPAVLITVALNDGVDLAASTIHATRKQVYPAAALAYDNNAPVRVVAYRTTQGGSVFYRCSLAMTNELATSLGGTIASDVVTMTDTDSDDAISVGEKLYTTDGGDGNLSSNAPPPTLLMVVSNSRLWGVDTENPERIWCTKTFQEGEAPGYNPGLQVLIPGAGVINGIGGQDDKLYAFATEGTYIAAFGPGPDNTAQGGGFPDPVLITTSALCDDPRGVITSQNGIYFTGPDHWGTTVFLLKRGDGAPINIGTRIRDELHDESTGTPQIRGVVERKDKARVEFLFVDSDTDASSASVMYYHYDMLDEEQIGQWTKATPHNGVALECIGVWDGLTVVGASGVYPSLALSRQTGTFTIGSSILPGTDNGNAFEYRVVTGDIRPFGLVGYGDVHSLSVMGTGRTRPGFLEISASYDSRVSFPEAIGTNTRETDGSPMLRRWEPTTKKLPAGSVAYQFRENLVSEGGQIYTDEAILHGLSIEVMPLGGNVRLPTNCRDDEEQLIVPVGTSTVVKTGPGTSMTVTGIPTGFGSGLVTLQGPTGPVGTGTFSWSFLGQSGTLISTSNLNYALGTTGVTIHFVAGGFPMGTTYSWTSV